MIMLNDIKIFFSFVALKSIHIVFIRNLYTIFFKSQFFKRRSNCGSSCVEQVYELCDLRGIKVLSHITLFHTSFIAHASRSSDLKCKIYLCHPSAKLFNSHQCDNKFIISCRKTFLSHTFR